MHRVVNALTVGSIGDLALIAGRLSENDININAIGGGEGPGPSGRDVGVISLLVSDANDPDDETVEGRAVDVLAGLDLGNGRTLEHVVALEALDLVLTDAPGQLAAAAARLGDQGIDILGLVAVEVHVGQGIVSLGFADEATRDTARGALEAPDAQGASFVVMPKHGGRDRRREIDEILEDHDH
jgi:hypothetical protein